MMDFDYKKYSLEKLEDWVNDVVSGDASPQEIYDVIKGVVDEQYHYHKHHTGRCYELLSLLNGTVQFNLTDCNKSYFDNMSAIGIGNTDDYICYNTDPAGNVTNLCDTDNISDYCKGSWNDFWEENYYPEEHSKYYYEYDRNNPYRANPFVDKVVKWQLPVEVDAASNDYYVQFPDDLLKAANLKEGDQVEWVDNLDGSYTLRKV